MYFVLVMTPRGKGRSHTSLLGTLERTFLSVTAAGGNGVLCTVVTYGIRLYSFAFAHLCDDDDSGKDCFLANIYRNR
jgi:hypothetical protein